MEEYIIVSNWEQVDADDFYLSDDWAKSEGEDEVAKAKALQEDERLYVAYIVGAVNFAIYRQMDADKVFINAEGDVILHCESGIIDSSDAWDYREKYSM